MHRNVNNLSLNKMVNKYNLQGHHTANITNVNSRSVPVEVVHLHLDGSIPVAVAEDLQLVLALLPRRVQRARDHLALLAHREAVDVISWIS